MKAGWQTKTLDEICLIGDGNHSSNYPTKDELVESGIPFIRSTNLIDGKVCGSDMRFLTPEKHAILKKGHLKSGDILITNRGEIGKTAIVDDDFENSNLNSQIAWLRCREEIDNKFLYYTLNSVDIQKHFQTSKSGTALQQFTIKQLKELSLSLPHKCEQQRIVTILDEAFEGIATATANAKKNLANARELFDSEMQAVFTECSATWSMHTLKEMSLVFGRGKSKHRPRNDPKLYGGSYPFIQTGNIRNAGHIVMDYTQTYNELGLAQSKLWSKGTLCITIAANIAETAILGFDSCFPDSVIGFVADPTKSDVHFVEYLLTSFKARLQAKGKGSAQDNLNLATFEGERFPFPSVIEQKIITAQLDELSTETKKLEAIYQQKLTALEELKKSILNQAFSGQLN